MRRLPAGFAWLPLICVFAELAFCLPAGKPISEYDRRIWQTQDGLPEDTIQAITETSNGYLWIGTREGLARFDGFRFVVFDRSNTPAFRDDSVLSLCAAANGALWIGTEGGGLLRYASGAFTTFGAADGLTDGFVRVVYQDHLGRILVGTDHGLFRLAGKGFVRMDGHDGFPRLSVHALTEDPDGRLWIGGSGLFVLDRVAVQRIHLDRSAASDQIKSILIAKNGAVWVGAYSGLYRIQDGTIRHYPFNRDIETNIVQDDSGNVWFGWVGDGLTRFHDGDWATFHAPATLPNNTVLSIYEDSDRDLWIGTENGLLRISNTGVSVLENRDGVALGNSSTIYENVSTIYSDRSGALWIADGHLYRIKDWSLIPHTLPSPARTVNVRTVFKDSHGTLWLGAGGQGVTAIRHGVATRYTTRQGLVNDFIRAFCEDRAGNLWIGTDGGVSVWDGKEFRNYDASNGLVYPSVRTIVETRNGSLWIGTDGGISVVRNGAWLHLPALQRLRGERVWSIHQDASGDVWIGTRGDGIFRLKNGKLSHYTTACGLPDDNIYQILQDRGGNLWLSGRAGISQIPLKQFGGESRCSPGSLSATVYVNSGVVEAGEVNGGVQPAGSSTPSGALWFPTVKGAVRIEPDQVHPARLGKVIIEQVIADGHHIPTQAPDRIRPGEGRLEIQFTAPALMEPEQVRFKYRLDGFDRRWIRAGTEHVAYYTNLPPGKYRFRVVAFSGRPAANSAEADFSFVWEAHFYQSAWFYTLCIASFCSLLWIGFRVHLAQTKARYAAVLAERSRLAREMHDTVIQGCAGVSALLEAASTVQPGPAEIAHDLLDRARIQIRQTLSEAREAVWDLRHTSIEGGGIGAALTELARQVTVESGIDVRAAAPGAPVPLSGSVQANLLLVAREAARNALEHASASSIFIGLSIVKKSLSLEIVDDGCGFTPPPRGAPLNGHYGIVGMRERIDQMGGEFQIVSERGKGTRVTAVVPLKSGRRGRASG